MQCSEGVCHPRIWVQIVPDIQMWTRVTYPEAMIQSEKLAVTGELAASLAHEINNPLQTVIGCLGLAEELAIIETKELGAGEEATYSAEVTPEEKGLYTIYAYLYDGIRRIGREVEYVHVREA